MAYLVKSDRLPVKVQDRAVEWIELIGTWGILAFLVFSFAYERRFWHGPKN